MKRLTTLHCVLILALVGLCLPATAASRYKIDQPVEFEMITKDGGTLTSESLRGKLVVVEFWATWCGPCIDMIPHLRSLHRNYKDKGVEMISVSVDRESDVAKAKTMSITKKMFWTMVFNAEQDRPLNSQFFRGSYSIPNAFLISPEGKLLWNGHPASLETQIKSALKTNPPFEVKVQGDVDGGAMPTEPIAIARLARQSVAGRPDFRQLLSLAAAMPEDALGERTIKAQGRSINKALGKLDGDMLEMYQNYRENLPEEAAALDRWIAAATDSFAEGTAGEAREISPKLVAKKFKEAEEAEAAGDIVKAYEGYRWIVQRAPNSDEALLAQDIVLTLEDDPEFMAQLELERQETAASKLMQQASNYIAAEMEEMAEKIYQDVIKKYPDTQAAKIAQKALDS